MTESASEGTPQTRTFSFAGSFLKSVAALVIVLAGLRAVSDIVGPVFLALVITITLHPIRVWLERRGLRGWLASIIMLIAAYLVLIALAFSLLLSVSQLAALIPQYSDQLLDMVASVGKALSDLGMKPSQVDAITSSFDPGRLLDAVMALLSGGVSLLANLFFLVTLLLFFAFDTDSTRRSLAAVGRERFPGPVDALANFARGTRNYMGVSSSFGLIVAVVDGVVLYVLDVPGAFVWAVLAFVTNFIPNIGFVIGVIPPALIALLDGGTGLMITVIVLYSVINFVIQSMIQPRVVGDAVGLSATLTFLSLVFWTWLVGPVGALLAVPFSLLTKALLVEADPHRHWALALIAGKPQRAGPAISSTPSPSDG
ncbi:AI-2E family transporter [Nocardioides alcanivorans]|uniref:AI-2E family transporter n=1 Tax=Nocardioides alcanivorans TaxID=2897352 RepID=UPI001F39D670|nr:AI-2E family transporter [Nocardioides alcanivorans]